MNEKHTKLLSASEFKANSDPKWVGTFGINRNRKAIESQFFSPEEVATSVVNSRVGITFLLPEILESINDQGVSHQRATTDELIDQLVVQEFKWREIGDQILSEAHRYDLHLQVYDGNIKSRNSCQRTMSVNEPYVFPSKFDNADYVTSQLREPNSDFYRRKLMFFTRSNHLMMLIVDENNELQEIDIERVRQSEFESFPLFLQDLYCTEVTEQLLQSELIRRYSIEESIFLHGEDYGPIAQWLALTQHLNSSSEVNKRLPSALYGSMQRSLSYLLSKTEIDILSTISMTSKQELLVQKEAALEDKISFEELSLLFKLDKNFGEVLRALTHSKLTTELHVRTEYASVEEMLDAIHTNLKYFYDLNEKDRFGVKKISYQQFATIFNSELQQLFEDTDLSEKTQLLWQVLYYKRHYHWVLGITNIEFRNDLKNVLNEAENKKKRQYDQLGIILSAQENMLQPLTLTEFETQVDTQIHPDRRIFLATLITMVSRGMIDLNSRTLEAARRLYCADIVTDADIEFIQKALKSKVNV